MIRAKLTLRGLIREVVREEQLRFVIEQNQRTYAREASLAFGILRCKHHMNGRQIPCPPMCPRQSWPESKFRRTFWTGRWKLRKEYR